MKVIKKFDSKKCIAVLVSFMLLIATTLGIIFGAKAARAETNGKLNFILQNISTDNVEINNDSFEIYGNSTLTDKEFRDVVNTGSPKIYLHYRTDRNIDLPYDALLEVKTDSKTYSYEFVEKERDDAQSILRGIKFFISKYSDILSNNDYYALESNAPMQLSSSVPQTFVSSNVEREYVARFSDIGYITYHIAVLEYVVDSESILYIVTVRNSFTPGIVAIKNGESGFGKYNNAEGYVHMTVEQAYDANEEYYYGRRWGNIPYKKDYWPINNPTVVTISSSIQHSKTFGYSYDGGFSQNSGLSIGGGISSSESISYAYQKSITVTNPALTAQVSASNTAECQWYYTYTQQIVETYNLETNYMFEISNSTADLFVGDFRLKLDYRFIVRNQYNFPIAKTESADLMVRAGHLKSIYRFCSGMI